MDILLPSIDINTFLAFLYGLLTGNVGNALDHKEETVGILKDAYLTFSFVSTCVSIFLLIGICYSLVRLFQIRKQELLEMHAAEHNYWHKSHAEDDHSHAPGYMKWQQVQSQVSSQNPHQWRLAILEADIILDELVYEHFASYGDTLGERLKRVDRSDFSAIDKAWEAHRIRNAIAHEGSSFELSERELRHILNLYEEVFNEFHYI